MVFYLIIEIKRNSQENQNQTEEARLEYLEVEIDLPFFRVCRCWETELNSGNR